MSFRIIIIFFVSIVPFTGIAQVDNHQLIEQIIEHIAEQVSEDLDYSEITERLNFYIKYPMDINKVQKEQLGELVFISPNQIGKILLHREESGPFQEILELQSIDGIDSETVRWLSSFLRIYSPQLLSDISLNGLIDKGEHDLMIRFGRIFQRQNGFLSSDSTNSAYAGSPDRFFTRYRFNYHNRISISINMEKDAGEVFLKNKGKGFDFYSASIFLKGERLVKKLVVGDYALQFGQGLTMWSGMGFGKGAGITTAAKPALGLRPYSSVNESSFLRGASATLVHQRTSITPFISCKMIDANLSDDGSQISSILISGLHRTSRERINKNSVRQWVYGLNTSFTGDDLNAGFTIYRTEFDRSNATGNSLYERFDFSKKSLTNLGIHYSYTFKNTYFFGEAAHSVSSGTAFLKGAISSLSNQISAVILYRNYARNYHSFFNQGLAESINASNEKGFYVGMNIKFDTKLDLSSYIDFFKFPWLKFRVDAPSQGQEILSQLTYSLNKRFKLSGRFKFQQKEENSAANNFTGGLEIVQRQNYRFELNYKAGNSFSIRNRAEIAVYRKGEAQKEFGFLAYQDIIYKPLSSKFSGNLRFAIFDTSGFNSRIYAYENDVLYGYSVPAYQNQGIKWYVNGRYTPRRGIDIWLRYALLSYSDQETVGSGHDMIAGNQRSDFKLQMRFQF